MKTTTNSILLVLSLFVFTFCTVPEKKGVEQNKFRKAHGGILLQEYQENRIFSTDEEGENGVSLFRIQQEKEQEFRQNKTGYLQSKYIHFDSLGIFQEKNIVRKVINDSTEWFINTSDVYRANKVEGFIVKMVNGSLLTETEIELNRPIRDSILRSWKMQY